MDPDDDHNRTQRHQSNYGPLKPHLAILQVKAHISQVANKIWLTGDVLAEARPNRGIGGDNICSGDSSKDDKKEIGNGVVAAETDKGGDILHNTNETDQ